MKSGIGAQKYWLTIFTEKISRTPCAKILINNLQWPKNYSCNTARRKSRAGAQKYWLRIFSMKISSCVRMKSRLGAQIYLLTTVTNKISRKKSWLPACPKLINNNISCHEQIISSCNSAIKTQAHVQKKYWLMIFPGKISSCARIKFRLGM